MLPCCSRLENAPPGCTLSESAAAAESFAAAAAPFFDESAFFDVSAPLSRLSSPFVADGRRLHARIDFRDEAALLDDLVELRQAPARAPATCR